MCHGQTPWRRHCSLDGNPLEWQRSKQVVEASYMIWSWFPWEAVRGFSDFRFSPFWRHHLWASVDRSLMRARPCRHHIAHNPMPRIREKKTKKDSYKRPLLHDPYKSGSKIQHGVKTLFQGSWRLQVLTRDLSQNET